MGEPRETAAEFVRVARVGDLAPGRGMVVVAKGIRVALFRHEDGTLYALRNQCPHMGGELGEGVLNGDIVTCPWHGWQFDVKTGVLTFNPREKVPTYEVKIEGTDILVAI
jgi:nitrite reductase/ring-hydroxylating ferredoxin subunit